MRITEFKCIARKRLNLIHHRFFISAALVVNTYGRRPQLSFGLIFKINVFFEALFLRVFDGGQYTNFKSKLKGL